MDPLAIQNHVRSMPGLAPLHGNQEIRPLGQINEPTTVDGKSFGDLLSDSIKQVNEMQFETDKAMEQLASGQGANVHDTLIAVQKAELSMKMLVEVRNKVVSAYQEVMRMQV